MTLNRAFCSGGRSIPDRWKSRSAFSSTLRWPSSSAEADSATPGTREQALVLAHLGRVVDSFGRQALYALRRARCSSRRSGARPATRRGSGGLPLLDGATARPRSAPPDVEQRSIAAGCRRAGSRSPARRARPDLRERQAVHGEEGWCNVVGHDVGSEQRWKVWSVRGRWATGGRAPNGPSPHGAAVEPTGTYLRRVRGARRRAT